MGREGKGGKREKREGEREMKERYKRSGRGMKQREWTDESGEE